MFMKKFFLFSLIILVGLFSSCEKKNNKPNIKIEVLESTVKEKYYIDDFNLSSIKINISIDEETKEEILSTSLIENYPSEITEGSYTFIINYQGVKESLTLQFIKRDTYTNGLSFSLNKTNDGYIVSNYSGNDNEIIIPASFEYLPVKGIKAYTFNNKPITKVNLPNTIEYIGDNAFSNTNISLIDIPSSVVEIGDAAFYNCVNLKSVTLHNTLREVGDYAFYNTTLIYTDKDDISDWNSNAFDDNLTYIHKGLNLSNIVKNDNFEYYIDETVSILNYTGDSKIVEIPDIIDNKKVTVIENAAFFGNKTIEEIKISNNIIYIKDRAFKETNLVSVNIPSSVKEIGVYAFSVCEELESVTFNEGLEKINISAFAACHKLTKIILPSTLTTIEQYGFQNCLNMKIIYIPKSVVNIGDGAFYACGKSTIYLEESSVPSTWSTNFNPSKAKLSFNASKDDL